jgi:S-adenosyl methyltransferase
MITSPICDYQLGGKDHWQADRDAAEKILAVAPGFRDIARANRAFLTRAVRHLARDKDITQFLDIGTGIPTSPNVHETAAEYASSPPHRPRARRTPHLRLIRRPVWPR